MKLSLKSLSSHIVAIAVVASALILPISANAQTSPSAYTSATRYDDLGRVVGTIAPDPDGSGALKYIATRTSYDTTGRPIKVETGELSVWKSEAIAPSSWGGSFTVLASVETTYDAIDRKIKEFTKGSNGVITGATQYSYDNRGRLLCTAVRMNPAVYGSLPASACTLGTAGSQGPDRITKNIYNAASQVLKVQKAVGTSIQQDYVTYTYTTNGKQASVVDANGNRAAYTYDGLDRLVRWNFPHKTSAGTTSTTDYESYTYDNSGNRLTHRKRDNSILSFQYDALNRMTRKTVPERAGLSSTHTQDVFYRYDLRGLQIAATFGHAGGYGVRNTYDGFGRMKTSNINISGFNKSLVYHHDKNGNRIQLTHSDNQPFNYEYDGLNRTNVIKHYATNLATYSYNNRGLQATLGGGVATSISYDPAGRLSALAHNLAGGASDVTYGITAYNPSSQVITRNISNDGYAFNGDVNVNRNYSVNGLNQYTSAGPANFTYDANGNLTSDGSSSYLYDIENRLVQATGANTANLKYDPLGRLFETSGGIAGTTKFQYDGDELVGEYNSSGVLLKRYVHGRSVDDPLIWYDGAGVSTSIIRRLRTDHQGSIIAVTDYNGNAIQLNSYDDWGIPAATNMGRFQYTGQAHIPELDMYYYKARIYSPTLGRFLQTDPIGYKDQVNLYAYVGNDPINMGDPTGESRRPRRPYQSLTTYRLDVQLNLARRELRVLVPGYRPRASMRSRNPSAAAYRSELTGARIDYQHLSVVGFGPLNNQSRPAEGIANSNHSIGRIQQAFEGVSFQRVSSAGVYNFQGGTGGLQAAQTFARSLGGTQSGTTGSGGGSVYSLSGLPSGTTGTVSTYESSNGYSRATLTLTSKVSVTGTHVRRKIQNTFKVRFND